MQQEFLLLERERERERERRKDFDWRGIMLERTKRD